MWGKGSDAWIVLGHHVNTHVRMMGLFRMKA